MLKTSAVVLSLLLVACSSIPTGPDSGDPREDHVLAETERFAGILHVKVHAVVTDEVYLCDCSDGTRCPAAGWYHDGQIKYWRPAILRDDHGLAYGSALAAHETCHALHSSEDGANRCAAALLGQSGNVPSEFTAVLGNILASPSR